MDSNANRQEEAAEQATVEELVAGELIENVDFVIEPDGTPTLVGREPTEEQIRQAAELMEKADRERAEQLADRERRNNAYRLENEERKVREAVYLKWIASVARANVGKAIAGTKVAAVWRDDSNVLLELPGEDHRAISVSVYETTIYRGNYTTYVQTRAEELGHVLDTWGYAHTETIYQVTSCVNCRAIVAIPRDGPAYGPLLQEACKATKKK